jgi:hypothetical protein
MRKKYLGAREIVRRYPTGIAPVNTDHTTTVNSGSCPSVSRSTMQPIIPKRQKIATSK